MAHIELNITQPEACSSSLGVYYAIGYYLGKGGQLRWQQVPLGHDKPDIKDSGATLESIRKRLGERVDQNVPIGDVAAVSLLRACMEKKHAKSAPRSAISLVGERLTSFVLARSLDDIEAIEPIDPTERPNLHGLGSARRRIAGTMPIRPVIHLPITPEETREYTVTSAIRALPARGRADDPYVALHGDIEQIITPDMLH